MSEVVGDSKFMVWFLKRKSRIKFLSMTVRHDFFKRNKDIRLYIAKWFFYDYVNILPRLVELGRLNYPHIPLSDLNREILDVLNSKKHCTVFCL